MTLKFKEKRDLSKLKSDPIFGKLFLSIYQTGRALGLSEEEIYRKWKSSEDKNHPNEDIRSIHENSDSLKAKHKVEFIDNKVNEVDIIFNDKALTEYQKLEKLFTIYDKTHNKYAYSKLQQIRKLDVADEYIKVIENFSFGLEHGYDYSEEAFDNPFKNFMDNNFEEYKNMCFGTYVELKQTINECAKDISDAFSSIYPNLLQDAHAMINITNMTEEIIKIFVCYHGFNNNEFTMGGAAAKLGFSLRHNSFNNVVGNYLWMFKEDPNSFLDNFLEGYNTRVMNYIQRKIEFRTVSYNELTPLNELDFNNIILVKETNSIRTLAERIYDNPRIVASIKRNSDSHFLEMLQKRLSV